MAIRADIRAQVKRDIPAYLAEWGDVTFEALYDEYRRRWKFVTRLELHQVLRELRREQVITVHRSVDRMVRRGRSVTQHTTLYGITARGRRALYGPGGDEDV